MHGYRESNADNPAHRPDDNSHTREIQGERPAAVAANSDAAPVRGKDQLAVGEWLPLMQLSLATNGDSLERHVLLATKRVFQVDSWTCVFILWPGTAVLTKSWARVLLVLLGLWELLRPPEGLARMTWQHGASSIPNSVVRQARNFRFTTLVLRNGHDSPLSHGIASFGLLRGNCKVSGDFNSVLPLPANSSEAIISFQQPVFFDGWYIHTGSGLPEFDPRVYFLEASSDGQEWQRVAASWSNCGCFYKPMTTATSITRDLTALKRDFAAHRHASLPEERGAEIVFRFGTQQCTSMYFMLVLAQALFALSMIVAPVLAIVCTRQDIPLKFIAVSSILSAIMSIAAIVQMMDS